MDEVLSLTETNEILNYKPSNSKTSDSISLTRILTKAVGEHVAVYYGLYLDRPVVVKYYHGRKKKDIKYEISIMKYAQKIGMPIYWFSGSFTLLGRPVLVMEKLLNITPMDDIKQLVVDVLIQLKYLHSFCCHCDIKRGNVMKRTPESDKLYPNPYAKNLTYFLIDYGGCAKNRDRYGFARHTFTPNYTSQPRGKVVIVTFVHDLLELCYLANYLLTRRETKLDFDHRHQIQPALNEFYQTIIHIKPQTRYDSKIHEMLIEIAKRSVPN